MQEEMMSSQKDRSPRMRSSLLAELSPRELEVAVLIAAGMTYREIGEELMISHHTVNSHLKSILGKTGLSSSRKLAVVVSEAIRRGEITDLRDGTGRGDA